MRRPCLPILHAFTLLLLLAPLAASAAPPAPAATRPAVGSTTSATTDGYRGIWYMNQPQPDAYKFKYSGGFATYPQQHIPMAIYAAAAKKTFFCFGGKVGQENLITDLVGCFDHATGQVSRPTVILSRRTNDTHYNPTLSLDETGHVYVFANCHGAGSAGKSADPTHGRAYVFRSQDPYSTAAFECVRDDNFSYSQPWPVPGKGLLWLHTRYENGQRRLYYSTSLGGRTFTPPQKLTHMAKGNYQISWAQGDRVATAFDFHPDPVGLNARTNLYYLETRDFGRSFTTITGEKLDLPLRDIQNPALIRDYQKEGLLVYLKDLTFDAAGQPVILYLTSRGHASGPANGPRTWHTARWTGSAWTFRPAFTSDHNYDHGSLYLEPDGTWRIVAPTEPGPQPHASGGRIAVHVSKDQGQTWQQTALFPLDSSRNQTYVRRPLHADPAFYGLFADGDAFAPSESDLFFCTQAGQVFRLPRKMEDQWARPEEVR